MKFKAIPFIFIIAQSFLSLSADVPSSQRFVPFSELFYILEGYPMDPVWAWSYKVCIDDECLCPDEKYTKEPTLQTGYEGIIRCMSLPPYIRKLDLRQHP